MLLYIINRDLYVYITREDRVINWLTFFFLLISGILSLLLVRRFSKKSKSYTPFLIIFGVLLILSALEEISWGQRLIGLESPPFFIEYSDQKEINIHNVFQKVVNVKTKHITAVTLFIYGVCLPVIFRDQRIKIFSGRLIVLIPPTILIISFLIGTLLMIDRPSGQEEEYSELFLSTSILLFILLEYFFNNKPLESN
jgi:hypothetical protein